MTSNDEFKMVICFSLLASLAICCFCWVIYEIKNLKNDQITVYGKEQKTARGLHHEQHPKGQLQKQTNSNYGISGHKTQNLPANEGICISKLAASCSLPESQTKTELIETGVSLKLFCIELC